MEATGLGGKDLGVVGPWDISIRTDAEGQNVYGPSLATVEDVVLEPCRRPPHPVWFSLSHS